MGQQQLFLLVMGVIIVGFAVLAGFTAAETKFKQSVADTLVEHNLTIATEAVFWKTKMDPFSGGNMAYTGLDDNGLETLSLKETTTEGQFAITAATADALEITAVSLRFPDIGVRTYVSGYDITGTDVVYDGTISLDAEE